MGSHFEVGAPPILVYFSGDWDVHWGYGILTHGHMFEPVAHAKQFQTNHWDSLADSAGPLKPS